MLKPMNVDDWVTPSASGKRIAKHPEGQRGVFRKWGFYEGMVGVIIEREYCTFGSEWEYTVMWTNADITKHWTRGQLKYARVKR